MDDSSLTERQRVLRVPAGRDDVADAVADAEVPVARVGPTGVAALAPLVTATADGETALYANCPPDRAAAVATDLAVGTVGTAGGPTAVVEHAPDAATFPVPADTALGVGTRRLLAGAGWQRPTVPADYSAAGGFVDADGDAVLAAADGLLGRGWGDWCHDERVVPAWRRARDGDGGPGDGGPGDDGDSRSTGATVAPTVVLNAHGNAADALLLESVPFAALEGADLLARAVDADRVVVYASEADETALDRARAAAAAYPDPAAPVEVVAGPAVYRAAEPTMALEAIEGNHRLEARLRQPGALPRLDGAPALVHTARTLAHLADRVRAASDRPAGGARRTSGTPGGGDDRVPTHLVTVTGDVEAPATVELPETATLGAVRSAAAPEGTFKAASVGGRFGGLTASLDVAPDPESLAAADLGTEGVVEVLADDRCVVEFVGRRARWAADTNCGRCVPCREGTTQLTELLRDVYDGDYDEAGIAELLRVVDAASVCGFGPGAARPTRTAMAAFDAEFAAHADGRCPAGACFDTAEVPQ